MPKVSNVVLSAYYAGSFARITEVRSLEREVKQSCPPGLIINSTSHWLESGRSNKNYGTDPQFSVEDMDDVCRADIMIQLLDGEKQSTRGGRHTELGLALAWKKPIFLVGKPEQIFHYHPSIVLVEDSKELVAVLKGFAINFQGGSR